MLSSLQSHLNAKRIILGSNNLREIDVLKDSGFSFEVIPPAPEDFSYVKECSDPTKYAIDLAFRKSSFVEQRLAFNNDPHSDLIITAETVVHFKGKVFGIPPDGETAAKYLKSLSGETHSVTTGVVLKTPSAIAKFYETTLVTMTNLSPEAIWSYIRTKEPFTHMGGYDAMGSGGGFIESIDGCFFNIQGVPLNNLCEHIIWLLSPSAPQSFVHSQLDYTEKSMSLEKDDVSSADVTETQEEPRQSLDRVVQDNFESVKSLLESEEFSGVDLGKFESKKSSDLIENVEDAKMSEEPGPSTKPDCSNQLKIKDLNSVQRTSSKKSRNSTVPDDHGLFFNKNFVSTNVLAAMNSTKKKSAGSRLRMRPAKLHRLKETKKTSKKKNKMVVVCSYHRKTKRLLEKPPSVQVIFPKIAKVRRR